MRTNSKSFAVALVVMSVAVLGLLYMLWGQTKTLGTWPNEKERTSFAVQKRSLIGENKGLKEKLEILPVLTELMPYTKKEDAMARQVLPSKFAPHELAQAIREKAVQSGITVRSITPSTQRGRGGDGEFETINFNLRLEGTYDQVATFVNSMEGSEQTGGADGAQLRRFFKVNSLEITPRNNGLNISDPHAAALTMSTYRYTGDSAQ